jgi:PAS domain S-box-containing protein
VAVCSRALPGIEGACEPPIMTLPPAPAPDPEAMRLASSFQAMAANVPGALFRYRQWADGRNAVQYMSPRCLDLWELPADAIVADASRLWAMVDPDDLPGMADAVRRSAETLQPWRWEWRITTPSGRRKWLEGRGVPERLDDGSVLWNSLILDVTERRSAEEALRVKDAALESSLNGIALAGLDGRLTYVNPAFCALWFTTPDQALGRHASEFWRIREEPDAVINAILRDGHWQGEMQAARTDGTLFELAVAASLVKAPDGRPLCLMGSFIDVTARNRAERALNELNMALEARVAERTASLELAKVEAERANRAKSEFVSHMSHELRTPMNAVLGFAQLLDADRSLTPRQRDYVREILRGGRHLLTLINDALDLARVEAGQLPVSLEPVALGPAVDESLRLLAPLAAARAVRLSPVPCDWEATVRADRTRLIQVLVNLVSNAIKYNREGGEVALDLQPAAAGRVRFTVRDTGPGIPPGRVDELFRPFSRLNVSGRVEGTGIGLVITRQLVELMGGEIDVQSVVDQGTTFAVELSLATPLAPAEGTAVRPGPPGPRRRALYIDDNPANLRLMTEMLAGVPSLEVTTAHMGGLGLDLARVQRPDVVLLDLQLPDMDGYEVLAALRALPGGQELPVIAVTSLGGAEDRARGLAAGLQDYLVKPVVLDQVRAAIDRVLKGDAHPPEPAAN